jgi:hypothetical protein
MNGTDAWHKAKKGEAHRGVFEQARGIEFRQSSTFDRFYQLECLYDPELNRDAARGRIGVIDENVVATNVDTVAAVVAATEIRPRVQTDGADWQTQLTARELELYGEGLLKEFEVHPKSVKAFKEAEVKGTGINMVGQRDGKPYVDPVLVDNVLADDRETEFGDPNVTAYIVHRACSKDELIAAYPDAAKAIESSTTTTTARRTYGGSPRREHEVVVIEAWRLPVGKLPGRYVKCIDGADLEDKPYKKPYFPFARMVWGERRRSFYGISLAERIAGHQRSLNRRNWHIQRMLDQNAAITTWVSPADANLRVQTAGPLGTIAVVRGERPTTVAPPMVNAELYKSREDLRAGAGEESGVSRMAAYATKPPGIESGVAMREFRDITTQRFASQEKAFETFVLDTLWLLFEVCKELGEKAPKIQQRSRFGARQIKWADVDLGDVRIQLTAASTLSRTPAGRQQTVLEWAQAGVISMDEARRLMRHPDLERSMSLYTAAVESVEADLYEISRGKSVVPGPFANHKMCVWRGQAQALLWERDGAPESVLEDVRQYVVIAAWMVSQASAPAANDMAAPGAMPQPGADAGPMSIGAAPTEGPGVAALSPQAMQLVAS